MSAASPLPLPPVSKPTPGGRLIVPASSSTSIRRHSASARGRAGRRSRSERERIGQGAPDPRLRGTPRIPPRRSRRAGWDRPGRRSSRPPTAPRRTARRSSSDAGTSGRGSSLSAVSSLSRRKRESAASNRAMNMSALLRGERGGRRAGQWLPDDQANLAAHGIEGEVVDAHDEEVATGGDGATAPDDE